jgi:hypothetical protein
MDGLFGVFTSWFYFHGLFGCIGWEFGYICLFCDGIIVLPRVRLGIYVSATSCVQIFLMLEYNSLLETWSSFYEHWIGKKMHWRLNIRQKHQTNDAVIYHQAAVL